MQGARPKKKGSKRRLCQVVSIKPVDPPSIPEVPAGRRLVGGWHHGHSQIPPHHGGESHRWWCATTPAGRPACDAQYFRLTMLFLIFLRGWRWEVQPSQNAPYSQDSKKPEVRLSGAVQAQQQIRYRRQVRPCSDSLARQASVALWSNSFNHQGICKLKVSFSCAFLLTAKSVFNGEFKLYFTVIVLKLSIVRKLFSLKARENIVHKPIIQLSLHFSKQEKRVQRQNYVRSISVCEHYYPTLLRQQQKMHGLLIV